MLSAVLATVASPDGKLKVDLSFPQSTYTVTYDGKQVLLASPLGLTANFGDFKTDLQLDGQQPGRIDETYTLSRSKVSSVHYVANTLVCSLSNAAGQKIEVEFRVSDHDIAFRYNVPRDGETGSIRVMEEATGFRFPEGTTTFLTPLCEPMTGWKRTQPSYEEFYQADAPMDTPSQFGHGYTFPCLFHTADDCWALVSETGLDSRYCGCHLSDCTEGGLYTVKFPLAEENNGNGTSEPAFALPGSTPWRTITVGTSLKPIVETTAPWDNVKPRFESTHEYRYGRSTWSWIIWQDASMNWDDQVTFIDLAHDMGYEYILVDAGWDQQIGYEKMEELVKYAQSRNVDVFLWYSSSGYWNDIIQSPVNRMDNSIARKAEMQWMEKIGVKGIKVDFWGGDKQECIRMYEEVLSDADDHGLMCIFHGCTIPRGWERMYPNYVGSEAVRASENLVFGQYNCDQEAFNACLHPFIRNTVGCMEFGGCILNERLSRDNQHGTIRRTSEQFELATLIIFQNPVQNIAITPNNLKECAPEVINFLKSVPTTWDETEFVDGYPGKWITLRRRHGDKWYTAGIDARTNDGFVKVD